MLEPGLPGHMSRKKWDSTREYLSQLRPLGLEMLSCSWVTSLRLGTLVILVMHIMTGVDFFFGGEGTRSGDRYSHLHIQKRPCHPSGAVQFFVWQNSLFSTRFFCFFWGAFSTCSEKNLMTIVNLPSQRTPFRNTTWLNLCFWGGVWKGRVGWPVINTTIGDAACIRMPWFGGHIYGSLWCWVSSPIVGSPKCVGC